VATGKEMAGKKIGLTYDLKKDYIFREGDPCDANAEFDHEGTIEVIAQSFELYGHKVIKIGNVNSLLENVDNLNLDIVFNISEGLYGRNRESQVPIILEMKGIPFVGADGLTLGLTLDKVMTKKIFISDGIPTPRFFEADSGAKLNGQDLNFPLIVKPRYEGSSKGLTNNSLTYDLASLRRQVDWVVKTYNQSALIEEFIRGWEFTVAIIGNDTPEVLPIVQIKINGKLKLGELFYTFSHISSSELQYICPARISKRLKEEIEDLALRAYRTVECRDFGRVDIRVDEQGRPYVLEINPLPSLSTEDVFMTAANYLKVPYHALINKILNSALKRYGLA
jgi:D-alanine-D-alanine ligase